MPNNLKRNKMTAVEWLMDKLFDPTFDSGKQIDWFEQAKEMEKQQIINANWEASEDTDRAEQYYDETFNK